MDKALLTALCVLICRLGFSQGSNITSWTYNKSGHKAQYYSATYSIVQMTDSSDVQEVCYNSDTVYVRASGLASYIMGPWADDPFTPTSQNHSYILPRNPVYPSTTHPTLPTGSVGLLINGVLIYTAGDGKSYKSSTGTNATTGDGNWNAIAWVAHGDEFDANGGAHPDPKGKYHNHSNPYGLYDKTDVTNHSPIIGWAFDGFPIYGPFGYSTANEASSGVSRMEVSYQLRSITDRSSTSPAGPAINSTYPLGTYIEDYEYVSGLGDLDEYNGRYCVTPEFPSGTYAYFLGTNDDGSPTYPNILAKKFYGKNGFTSNFGTSGGKASKPKKSVTCYTPATACSISLASQSDVSCNSGSDGTATISITGFSSPTYNWTDISGTTVSTAATATSLEAGVYKITVSDGTCSDNMNVTIASPSIISASVSASNVSCKGSDGSINLTASGGTSPYTYSWNNAATTEDIGNLNAGTYSVTITDSKNCTATSSYTVSTDAALVLSATTINASCSIAGAVNLTVAGGSSPYAYAWSNGATTEDINNLVSGTYSVTVTDSKSCTATASTTVTQTSSAPSIVISKTDVACNGSSTGAITITVSGGSASYTYSWTNGATTKDINNLAAGVYSVTVTDSNDCTATASVTISQPLVLSLTTSKTDVDCNGNATGAINLAVSGGTSPYTYLWNNGVTSEDVSGLSKGSYSVDVTDSKSCTTTTSVTIIEPVVLSVTSLKTDVTCNGTYSGTINLTVSGGTSPYAYTWSNGVNTEDINNLSAGIYTVTVKDSKNCSSVLSTNITEPTALFIASSKTDVSCNGTSTGEINIIVSGGTSPYTYVWNTAATTEDVNNLKAGAYSVIVKDKNNCSASATISIVEPSAIDVTSSILNEVKGNDGSINITVSGGSGPYSYSWSNGATTEDISALTVGNYTVIISDSKGCTKTATYTVESDVISSAEDLFEEQASIYPNPSPGNFTINILNPAITAYRIYDMKGKTVSSGNLYPAAKNITIDDGKGLYVIYLLETKSVYKRKLIID